MRRYTCAFALTIETNALQIKPDATPTPIIAQVLADRKADALSQRLTGAAARFVAPFDTPKQTCASAVNPNGISRSTNANGMAWHGMAWHGLLRCGDY